MPAFYNDTEPYVAQWLRNLIVAEQLSDGVMDERDIKEITAADLAGRDECHFFAGIGGWPLALQLAGWRGPVWTASLPCPSFSAAGKRGGVADARHLWPAFYALVRELHPPTIFGEQVEAAIGFGWLDGIFADLERAGYACGAAVLPAAGVGAPHIRQRLYWVADSNRTGRGRLANAGLQRAAVHDADGCSADGGVADSTEPRRARAEDAGTAGSDARQGPRRFQPEREGVTSGVDDSEHAEWRPEREEHAEAHGRNGLGRCGNFSWMADSDGGIASDGDLQRGGRHLQLAQDEAAGRLGNADEQGCPRESLGLMGASNQSHWAAGELIQCLDGKARRIGSGVQPLAHGVPARVGKLRAYGNAIVPQVAAEFVRAFMESARAN